ncbi:MAG: ORF6N domain-containing protein [Sulfurimonadaceae bacterium]
MELTIEDIHNKIFTVRGVQVMLDSDLAKLYNIETKTFNQSIRRNIKRFPEDFRFQLNDDEKNELVTKCYQLQNLKHSYINPYVFTEQGVSMLSAVLKSDIAINRSVQIIRAFVNMKQFISSNNDLFKKINTIEKKQIEYEIKSDEKFDKIFDALEQKQLKPTQGIFYDGQIFDAYRFISDLLREANKKVILIDNYIDDNTLTIFSKILHINVTIYTHTISKQLKLDLEKYHTQYNNISVKIFKNSHDRFLIIDDKTIFHIGASLKDLGKKWFAFSKMDMALFEDMFSKLE